MMTCSPTATGKTTSVIAPVREASVTGGGASRRSKLYLREGASERVSE